MKYVLVAVLLAVLIKDTSYLGDHYVLRGASQILALFVGGYWLMVNASTIDVRKYFWFFLLMLVIGLSSLASRDPIYSVFQFLSLFAVCTVFLAYSERGVSLSEYRDVAIQTTVVSGTVVCALSLLLIKLKPEYAFLYDDIERIQRFRGLFGQPAAMGALAGLLFGITLFWKYRWYVKAPILTLAIICLFLTSARTFWVALIVASVVTMWWKYRARSAWMLAIGGVAAIILVASLKAFDIQPSRQAANEMLRTDSIENMSGRLTVWTYAFKKFWERPFLGYGFTTGDHAFIRDASNSSGKYLLDKTRYTLHNGYIQALLDTGIFGAVFYVVIVLKALYGFYRSRSAPIASALFALLFLAISNLGESVMFSAATFSSLLAWYLVVLGLGLSRERLYGEKNASPHSPPDKLPNAPLGKVYG